MKNPGLLILFILSFIFSCNSSDPYLKSREIYEQTMNLHDEVMPKMGEVLSVKHSLKMKLDSVSDPAIKTEIDSAMAELDRTYNSMMRWMADLQPVPDKKEGENGNEASPGQKKLTPEEMIKVQEKSLEDIKALKEQMKKSLDNGKELLRTL